MSRFFVPPEAVRGSIIVINGKEAHHIIDVMRLKAADRVVTFDGTGKEYSGIIKEVSRNSLTVDIVETRSPLQGMKSEITLIQALPKKDKMDYIVEKTTELGVRFIVPVVTERTIPDWGEAKSLAQAGRWRKIAMEAAKQCGRVDIPVISGILRLKDAVNNFAGFDTRLIAVLNNDTISIREAMKGFGQGKIVVAIGPEGDFTPDETKQAKEKGFKAISLGPRVLKSDTAGLALISILNYELSSY